jgi:hypothetical protein
MLKIKVMKSLKNVIKIGAALILFTIVVNISSCKKSGVSPSAANSKVSQVSFGVLSDASPANLAAAGSTVAVNAVTAPPLITFTSGIANVTRFEFEAKKDGVETSVETRNLMNVDLFALNPALVNTVIDTGTYKEIEVRLVLTQSSTSAIPLTLMGTVTPPQGAAIPFEFDFNQDLQIKAEAKNVVISATQNLKTMFLLHWNMILANISPADVSAATLTNGKIVVSSTSNAAIFNKIVANLGSIGETKFENEGGDDHGGNNGNGGHGNDGQGHN